MNIMKEVSTGISGVTINLSLAELIVLKSSIPVTSPKQSYSEKEAKSAFADKMAVFISKITDGIDDLNDAEKNLFKEEKEVVEANLSRQQEE